MKKFLLFFAVCAMVIVTSCGGDQKSVYEKIQDGQELTQDDYTVMIEYLDDAMSSNPMMDEGAMSEISDMDAISKKLDEWKQKYEYMEEYNKVLNANIDKLNDKNQKLLDEINEKLM